MTISPSTELTDEQSISALPSVTVGGTHGLQILACPSCFHFLCSHLAAYMKTIVFSIMLIQCKLEWLLPLLSMFYVEPF